MAKTFSTKGWKWYDYLIVGLLVVSVVLTAYQYFQAQNVPAVPLPTATVTATATPEPPLVATATPNASVAYECFAQQYAIEGESSYPTPMPFELGEYGEQVYTDPESGVKLHIYTDPNSQYSYAPTSRFFDMFDLSIYGTQRQIFRGQGDVVVQELREIHLFLVGNYYVTAAPLQRLHDRYNWSLGLSEFAERARTRDNIALDGVINALDLNNFERDQTAEARINAHRAAWPEIQPKWRKILDDYRLAAEAIQNPLCREAALKEVAKAEAFYNRSSEQGFYVGGKGTTSHLWSPEGYNLVMLVSIDQEIPPSLEYGDFMVYDLSDRPLEEQHPNRAFSLSPDGSEYQIIYYPRFVPYSGKTILDHEFGHAQGPTECRGSERSEICAEETGELIRLYESQGGFYTFAYDYQKFLQTGVMEPLR